jgi:hypothetical protein
VIALLLTLAAFWHRPRRLVIVYLAIAIVAIELSLGTNGHLYPELLERVAFLQGLRAPSRFGIVALMAIAMLAAFGLRAFQQRVAVPVAAVLVALAFGGCLVEYRTTLTLAPVTAQPPEAVNVYAAVRRLGPGVVLELPLPTLDRLPGHEALYAFWSDQHWHPLVNGYSGYYPPEFLELVVNTHGFPAPVTTAFLERIGVRYVIVHHTHLYGQDLAGLLEQMLASPALEYVGTFQAPSGLTALFLMRASR